MVQYEAKGIGAADEGLQTLLHEQYKGVNLRCVYKWQIIFIGNESFGCGKISIKLLETSHGRKGISLKKKLTGTL